MGKRVEGTGAFLLGLLLCEFALSLFSRVHCQVRVWEVRHTDGLQCLPWRSSLPHLRLLAKLQPLLGSRLGSRPSLRNPTRHTLPPQGLDSEGSEHGPRRWVKRRIQRRLNCIAAGQRLYFVLKDSRFFSGCPDLELYTGCKTCGAAWKDAASWMAARAGAKGTPFDFDSTIAHLFSA